MIEKELSERINIEVDKLFDDQIRFTQKLTRFPSLRGQEHTAQDFLFDELTKRNYALDRWTVNVEDIKDHPGFSPVKVDYSNAINIVGTHRPKKRSADLLYLMAILMWFQRDLMKCGHATPLIQRLKAIGCTVGEVQI